MAKLKNFTIEGEVLLVVGYLDAQHRPQFTVDFRPGVKLEELNRSELDELKKSLIKDTYDVMLSDLADRFLRDWGEEPLAGLCMQ